MAYYDPNCGDGALCVAGNTGLTACNKDCAGVWGGTSVEDNCGHCHYSNEVQENGMHDDCLNDCAGTAGGSAVDDECGVCNAYLYTNGSPLQSHVP
jgi:hypothetical protein